ncbi:MAG: phenylacetate-CoA oxygenase subunit PaaJ [Burkholderiales bacterium]|nr:phenylacetate-CoA oxygenase subunit PaaJ [Burkholderiales bacterium]
MVTAGAARPVQDAAAPHDALANESVSAIGIAHARAIAGAVPDPEIPVVTLDDLGILRDVRLAADGVLDVVLTPTYSGCPATEQIAADVQAALADAGWRSRVLTQLAPAWTTDWIRPAARQRLADYGIAPPHRAFVGEAGTAVPLRPARRDIPADAVACPRCGSHDTTETSHFGSTACKALYRCLACLEPFDYFKPY